MRSRLPTSRASVLLAYTALTASACVPNWVAEPTHPHRTLTEGPIRVAKTDGSVVMLRAPVTVSDSLVGIALNDPSRRVAIAASDVFTVETRASRKATPTEIAHGYAWYLTGLMALAAISIVIIK